MRITCTVLLFFCLNALAAELSAEKKTALDKQIEALKAITSDKIIIDAVKASNSNPDGKEMTQEKWAKLTVLDPMVRGFTKNPTAEVIRKLKNAIVTEAFLNNSSGTKVAFLAKTSSWSHKGKAKHEDPMSGKNWIGKPEVDESSGKLQIQVAVPVRDGTTVIGSLVVGYSFDDLK